MMKGNAMTKQMPYHDKPTIKHIELRSMTDSEGEQG